jgi:hypothetical protein
MHRMYKIIGADGKEYGPISAEGLRQWIAEGRANAQTKVQVEGSADWKRLEELPEFSPGQAGAAPLPAGPIGPLPSQPRTNSLATVGLVLGVLSVTLGLCCYGLPFNIAGIVCSLVALTQIRSDPQRERGHGLAITGLVLSLLSILLAVLLLVFSLSFRSSDWMRHFRHL